MKFRRMKSRIFLSLILGGLAARGAFAGEVIFNNGDKLTGKVTTVDGGKLKIKSDVAGEVTVDLKDVRTFSTDEPVQVRMKDKSIVRDKVEASTTQGAPTTQPAGTVEVAGKTVPIDDIKR